MKTNQLTKGSTNHLSVSDIPVRSGHAEANQMADNARFADHIHLDVEQPERLSAWLPEVLRSYLRALFNFEFVLPEIIRLSIIAGLGIYILTSSVLVAYPAIEKLSLVLLSVAACWQVVSSSFRSALLPLLSLLGGVTGLWLIAQPGVVLMLPREFFIVLFALGACTIAVAVTFVRH